MRCQTCDKENAPSSSFCTNCGASLTKKTKSREKQEKMDRVSLENAAEPRGRDIVDERPNVFRSFMERTEDLVQGQQVIIAARWVLVVAGLTLALIHPDQDGIADLRVMIVVILGLAGANFYLHTQVLMKRPALARVVYGASVADLVAITLIVLAQGGFGSDTYVFYFPAILAFSVAFGTQMTFVFAGSAIAIYGLTAVSTYSGDNPEVIMVRLLMLAAVAFCGTAYWRIERQRREAAEQARESLKAQLR